MYVGVAQERYLATRTLHFAKETVFWQCFESWSSESFAKGIPAGYREGVGLANEILLKELVQTYRQNLPSPATSNLGVGSRLPIFDNIRRRWQCFIGSYSRNQLTKDSDIFVAL
jgi:hypothetical protein